MTNLTITKLEELVSSYNHSNVWQNWIEIFSKEKTLNAEISCPSLVNIHDSEIRNVLCSYISDVVPTLLKEEYIGGVLRYIVDDEKTKKYIFDPLEHFISNSKAGFHDLKAYSKPNKFCGKVFDVGDPTYSCKDCGADPTCVFCHDCFDNSIHKEHKYKFNASGGNGYCDCGDEEAWSSGPSCSLHKEGFETDGSDPLERFPDDLKNRSTFLLSFLLQYCVDTICCNETDSLPEGFSVRTNEGNSYIVMLFNDESHTYDEVIDTLKECVHCSSQQALHFATIVDKKGRSAIFTGSLDECKNIAADVTTLTTRNNKQSLKCEAIYYDVIAHQVFALNLMKWLSDLVNESDVMRRLLATLVTKCLHGRDEPIAQQLMLVDVKLWKAARQHLHELCMNRVILDLVGRIEFSKFFAECYDQVMRDFISDDHEHSVSVASLSVQIFTVPSLAFMLISEHGILLKCFTAFWNEISPAVGANGALDFQYNQKPVNVKRADYILSDLRYLLRHKPSWTPQLRSEFLKAFDQVLKLLTAMQGMDSCERKTKNHIAFEPNWEVGFNLLLWFVPIIELIISWCCSDLQIFEEVMKKSVEQLLKLQENLSFLFHDNQMYVKHDVSKNSVSIHAALSRFIAGLIPGALKLPLDLGEVMNIKQDSDDHMKLKLIEPSLRALVLMSQVNAQMWKRNGYSVLHQVYYYQNVRFGSEMFDRDLLLLQAMCSLMEPNYFLNILLHKYKLHEWLSDPETNEDSANDGKSLLVAQEFFLVLYFILSERYLLNIASVTSKEILQREVIHRLSLIATSRSALVKALPCKDPDDEELCSFEMQLDEVLKEVADYKEPGVTGKGLYHLKNEVRPTCSQYFYHYNKTERSKMLEQKKRLTKSNPDLQKFTLKEPPEFLPQLSRCVGILESSKMIELLKFALNREEKYVSEETVELALLIIGIGIIETKRNNPHVSKFMTILDEPSKDSNIKTLLEEMHKKKTKDYCGILKWLMQQLQSTLPHDGGEMEVDQTDGHQTEKERKQAIAQKRRAEMMAKMKNMQKAFLKTYQPFYPETMTEEIEVEEANADNHPCPVAIGVKCTSIEQAVMTAQCILCQEEENIENDKPMFVMTCFQRKSCVLVSHTENEREEVLPELNNSTRINVSSCGHIIHSECWEKYYAAVKQRELPTLYQRRKSCIDITQFEYLCPLCNSLCNTVLPLLPRISEEKCTDVQEMGLNEFMAYLERFSAELMAIPKAEKDILKNKRSSSRTFGAGLRRIIQTYIGHGAGEEAQSNENFMEMFAKKILQVGQSNDGNDFDNTPATHAIPLSWMSFSFSLQALECAYRENGKNIFTELSERQMLFLYAFVQYLSSSCSVGIYEPIAEYGRAIFNFFCADESNISVVEADLFGVLVSLRFLVSAVGGVFQEKTPNFLKIPTCLVNDAVFKICFLAYLVKVLVSTPALEEEEMSESDEDVQYLVDSWNKINELTGKSSTGIRVNGHQLKRHVVKSLLPFLRCSALFFHFLTGVNIPEELKTNTGTDQLESLLRFLNLPCELEEVLSLEYWQKNDHSVENMITRWCSVDELNTLTNETRLCYVASRRLIDLPDQYSFLIKKVSGFKCPTVGGSSRSPALCLICGTLICSQCYCCASERNSATRYGACSVHALECGKGVGIFLRVRECEVLMLYSGKKGCYISSPYLDEYGESDRGFKRGNPLFLHKSRYEYLHQLWLHQKIPETIAQAMESNRGLLAYDWNLI